LVCRFSVVCREISKMKGAPATVLPVVEDDLVADEYDDEEDDDGSSEA
jgi:hypothetical protein